MTNILNLNKSLQIIDAAIEHSLSALKSKYPYFSFERRAPNSAVREYHLQFWLNGDQYSPRAGDLGNVKLRKLGNSLTELSIIDSIWNNATTEEILRYSYWEDSPDAIANTQKLLAFREQIILQMLNNLKNDGLFVEAGPAKTTPPRSTSKASTVTYVDLGRIGELRALSSPNFDLVKLIRLCEEINICDTNDCFLATAMLVRAILDHVPPIFGFTKFSEVSSNYKGSKSFKESMEHLENSLRKIADHHLHVQIRNRESLPTRPQVNFSADLDVLLAEIVRLLK